MTRSRAWRCDPPAAPSTDNSGETRHQKKRAVIAFEVEAGQVSIIGVFYGGQDYAALLRD